MPSRLSVFWENMVNQVYKKVKSLGEIRLKSTVISSVVERSPKANQFYPCQVPTPSCHSEGLNNPKHVIQRANNARRNSGDGFISWKG